MSARLDPQLAATLARVAERHAAHRLPFIVTLAPGAEAGSVVPFVPTQVVDVIRMVAGEMTARQALDLAAHPLVERVEYDGQAHALADLAR
jgi:hypothetical protein